MRMKRALLADPKFVADYMAGHHDAKRKMFLLNVIEANGVAL
jgi:hypothetical protein